MTLTVTEPPPAASGDQLRALAETARNLLEARRERDLYPAIYREARGLLEMDGFYVSVYDAETDEATVVFWVDQDEEGEDRITYTGSKSEVIRSGKGTIVEDRLPDRSLLVIGGEGKTPSRSAVSAPLRSPRGILGAVSAQSHRPRAYGPDDLERLQALADVAAVALENARYARDLVIGRRRKGRMEDVLGRLVASLEPDEIMETLAQGALELLEGDGASLWLVEEDAARIAASHGPLAPEPGLRVPLEGEAVRILLDEREPVVIEDVPGSDLLPDEVKRIFRARSGVAVPLAAGDRLAGALSVGSERTRTFTRDETDLLQNLANHGAAALEKARLHASLESLSLTDPLTGLPNRRHLEMHLEKEFAAAQRGREVAVVLFDLDNFKEYNDALGHVAGDEVLRTLGEVLVGETRAMNLMARLGGDEFLAVLSDTGMEGARLHAERVRERIARHSGLGPHGISMSAGVAVYTDEMDSPEDLIRAADRDLYRSKGARPDE